MKKRVYVHRPPQDVLERMRATYAADIVNPQGLIEAWARCHRTTYNTIKRWLSEAL